MVFETRTNPTGISTAKAIQKFFNERGGNFDNRDGKHIKILFISEKFKEGIDLLDVPHIHIIDEPITDDEKEQIVGRIVRRCSRAGTKFDNGWKTNVFEYKIGMPKYTIEKVQHWLGTEQQKTSSFNYESVMKKNAVDKFINKNIHQFKITPGKSSLETDEIIPLAKPNINLSVSEYNKQVETIFKRFKARVGKMENKCAKIGQRFEFTPQQNFIRHYFNESSDIDTMLLWHAAGAGKTATAISTISSSFEQAGRNIIFVTRNSLVKDIEKNLYGDQTAHLEFRRRPMSQGARSRHLNRTWIKPMSYITFYNILSTHRVRNRADQWVEVSNESKRKLKRKTRGHEILENSLIVIDEIHKLGSSDMELIINEVTTKRYVRKPKILLMSATPFESRRHLNFVLSLMKRSKIDFMQRENIEQIVKGKISYFDPKTDLRYFPKAITKTKVISVPIPDFAEITELCKAKGKKERENINKSNLSQDEKAAARRRITERQRICKQVIHNTKLPNVVSVFKKYDK